MSDIQAQKHDWKRGDSVQWGERGLPYNAAATPYICAACGLLFTHFYHSEPNIYAALDAAGIDNVCEPA